MMNLGVRVYVNNQLRCENLVQVPDRQILEVANRLATQHSEIIGDQPFMIELEFLDEPNINHRFIRFGTDPRRMHAPLKVGDL